MRTRTLCAAATAALAVLCSALPAGAAPRPPGAEPDPRSAAPRYDDFNSAFLHSVLFPDDYPSGVNDFSCKPSAEHPRPVVLVHGTAANALSSFGRLAPLLKGAGYCVYAEHFGAIGPVSTGTKALDAVPESAKQVSAFVDKVTKATGTDKVDMVGYSQGGGLLARWYLKYEGGEDKVGQLVGISPSNHGTTLSHLVTLGEQLGLIAPITAISGAQALEDQTPCSTVNAVLDADGDLVEGVRYTTIVSNQDKIVTPHDNQFLRDNAGAERTRCSQTNPALGKAAVAKPVEGIVAPAKGPITNILLQDVCAKDFSGHLRSPYSPAVNQLVLNALDPENARPAPCTAIPPLGLAG